MAEKYITQTALQRFFTGLKSKFALSSHTHTSFNNVNFTGVIQNGRSFQNVCTFEMSDTVTEIVIKTKLPYSSGNEMPVIHLKGYAYGEASPIEITVGFYIYNNALGWCGATSTCPWKPIIYLSSYTENSTKYVALSLKKSIYFPRFIVDLTDIWSGTTRDYSKGWTTLYSKTSTTVIPQDDIIVVPYKSIANDIIGAVNGFSIGASVPAGAKFTDTTYTVATVSANGLMSSSDKSKLDGLGDQTLITIAEIDGVCV